MGERSIKLTAVVLAQLFIFPLLFGHSYVYPNWAINYRVLSVILIATWFSCFLFGGRSYLKFKSDVEKFFEAYPRTSFGALVLFLLWLYTYCVVDSFMSFGVNAIDFSYFDELIPSTLKGRWMYSEAYGGNHFGVHSTWIMLLLTPFYLVTKSPLILVVSHAFILVSTVFPLKKMLDLLDIKKSLTYFFILAFFLSSYMAQNLNYNFHVENFMIPLFMWVFYFIIKRDYSWRFWLVVVLSLLVKEDVAFYFLGAAFIVMLQSPKVGAVFMLLSLVTGIINLKIIIPLNRNTAEYVIASTAGAYGTGLSEIIEYSLKHPLLVLKDILTSGWKKLLLPYFGLPALSLSYWGFVIVAIYVHAMATSPFMKNIGLYYSAPFISTTLAGFVITVMKRKWAYERRETIVLLSAVLLLCVGNGRIALERIHPNYYEFEEALSNVTEVKVCAQASFYPHLAMSNQRTLLSKDCLFEDYDLYILSNTTMPYPFPSREVGEMIGHLEARAGYEHGQIGDIHFFKRVANERSESL